MQAETPLGVFDRQVKTELLEKYYNLHCTGHGAIKWSAWEQDYRKMFGELPVTLERLIVLFANTHRYYHYSSYELQVCLQAFVDRNRLENGLYMKKLFDDLCKNEKLLVKEPWFKEGVKFHLALGIPFVDMFDGVRYHSLRSDVMDVIHIAKKMLSRTDRRIEDDSSQSVYSDDDDDSSDSIADDRIVEVKPVVSHSTLLQMQDMVTLRSGKDNMFTFPMYITVGEPATENSKPTVNYKLKHSESEKDLKKMVQNPVEYCKEQGKDGWFVKYEFSMSFPECPDESEKLLFKAFPSGQEASHLKMIAKHKFIMPQNRKKNELLPAGSDVWSYMEDFISYMAEEQYNWTIENESVELSLEGEKAEQAITYKAIIFVVLVLKEPKKRKRSPEEVKTQKFRKIYNKLTNV